MTTSARTIAIANRKGGSGKTTTAVNLGAALALRGEKVLIIDLDPQANASLSLGVDILTVEKTLYELLLGMEESVAAVLQPTKVKGLSLLPAAPRLAGAELELAPIPGRENRLSEVIAPLRERYSYIIVDSPVNFGLLCLNILTTCDEVLAPVQTHHLSLIAIHQLSDLIERVKKELNPKLRISGLIPTMVDRRMKISKALIIEMEKRYGRNLVRPSIRLDAKLAEAPARGKPIQLYAPKSNGAYDYTCLADDIRVI